jgi:hypothetical protein
VQLRLSNTALWLLLREDAVSKHTTSVMNIHLIDILYSFRNKTVVFAVAKMFIAGSIVFHAPVICFSLTKQVLSACSWIALAEGLGS